MPNAVDSSWPIVCRATAGCGIGIRPKPEELASSGPMKGGRTRRVCTLRMLFGVERRPSQLGPIVSRLNSQPLLFQSSNCSSQPGSDGVFDLALRAVVVKRIQRLIGLIERNVAARGFCGAQRGWHKVDQSTIGAGVRSLLGIVVDATGEVFKNIFRPPGSFRGAAIAVVFEEFEFRFQNSKRSRSSFCILHLRPNSTFTRLAARPDSPRVKYVEH